VVQAAGGKLKLLVAEAESVPGPFLDIENTNSRSRKIDKLGRLLKTETVCVC
jgi:hypothetical protein